MTPLPFTLDPKWILHLYKKLRSVRKERHEVLERISQVISVDPIDLARTYIQPDCQEANPADYVGREFLVSRQPVLHKLHEFFTAKNVFIEGGNVLFLLSDAGVGKSALIAMLKLMHMTRFWPDNKEYVLFRIDAKTLQEIEALADKRNSVLLLDALDEYQGAYTDKFYIKSLLQATSKYNRVVITCRTQFFPDHENDPLGRPGRVVIFGFNCLVKYLSFFDSHQTLAYLRKRFPKRFWIFPRSKALDSANEVVRRMGSFSHRPMLLAFIEDFMESPIDKNITGEFDFFNAIINIWLSREEAKTSISRKLLRRACEILAVRMMVHSKRAIDEKELIEWKKRHQDLNQITVIDVKGRSLLNRDSQGNYRFSHTSIPEFLTAYWLVKNQDFDPGKKIHATDLIINFVLKAGEPSETFPLLDLQGINLGRFGLAGRDMSNLELSRVSFADSNLDNGIFSRADLRDAVFLRTTVMGGDFSGADLSGANLKQGDFRGGDFSGADLSGADLRHGKFSGGNFSGANISNSNLQGADLSETNLKDATLISCDLRGVKLDGAILRDADLQKSCLAGTDFTRIKDLTQCNLSETDLTQVNLHSVEDLRGTNFSGCNLSRADLSGRPLVGLQFTNAVFIGTVLTGADISYADFSGADMRSVDFRGVQCLTHSNFSSAILRGADLRGVDVEGVSFMNADMMWADLCGAKNVVAADLRGVDLTQIDLRQTGR